MMGNSRQRKRTQMTDDSRRRKGIRGEETWETSPLIKYLQGEKKISSLALCGDVIKEEEKDEAKV